MQALASTRHTTRPFSVSVKAPRVTSHKLHKSAGRAHTVQAMASASFYDLVAKDIDGNTVPFTNFKGKVCLITNVACQCGLTKSNYTELAQLQKKYSSEGLEILLFPCNQFGAQEPGSPAQIKDFVAKYDTPFKLMEKIEVNGAGTSPVYQYLKSSCAACDGDVTWNFYAKFLVDRSGNVVERRNEASAADSEAKIKELLAQSA